MNLHDRKLVKEIGIVLIIKLILLYGIWYYWVSGEVVNVNAATAAQHLMSEKH